MTGPQPDPPAAPARGHPGRVTEIHHQARRSLVVAVTLTVAAPVAAVVPHETGTWLPLHLFLVGGLLSAISGATQLLAVTWSAAPPPSRRSATVQRGGIAAGALAVAAGREAGSEALTATGAAVVMAALVLLGVHLVGIRRTAVTARFRPAIDSYLVAVVAGIAGTGLGAALVAGWAGTRWDDLRAAHLTINLFGLVGIVIAGTLPYFVATQARARMARWATRPRLRALTAALTAATAGAAAGHLLDRPGLAGAALLLYAVGIAAVTLLVPLPTRRQLVWAGPRLLLLGTGMAWWLATTLLLAGDVAGGMAGHLLAGGPGQPAILQAMAIGGFAQILLASLAYLGPVLRGGGHRSLSAGFALTRSWVGLVAANMAAAGAIASAPAFLAGGLVLWSVDAAARGAVLAIRRRQDRDGAR